MENKRLKILLVLASLCVMGVCIYTYASHPYEHEQSEKSATSKKLSTALPETNDPFALGQYYFNHDEDPSGPYDLEKAKHYYQQAIAQNPRGHVLTWYQLGRIDFLEGNFDAALEKFATQTEYFGSAVPNVYYMIGLTHGYKARATGDPEEWKQAEVGFETFLTLKPQSPWARTDLAWVYFAQGKYEDMKPVLEAGLVLEPDHAWLLNMYGLALLNTGDMDGAREHFLRAEAAAAELTTADWGRSYPGNNPGSWEQGLSEFRTAIAKNIALTE